MSFQDEPLLTELYYLPTHLIAFSAFSYLLKVFKPSLVTCTCNLNAWKQKDQAFTQLWTLVMALLGSRLSRNKEATSLSIIRLVIKVNP